MNQSERQLFEAVSTGDAATVKQLVGTVSVDIQDEVVFIPSSLIILLSLTVTVELDRENAVDGRHRTGLR